MKKVLIGIVDYSVGNQGSIYHTLMKLGYRVLISSDKKILKETDIIILPGVGAFKYVMESMKSSGLKKFLTNEAYSGKPIIGICLGMHLLSSIGWEGGKTFGLDLIPGYVKTFSARNYHIGWNNLTIGKQSSFDYPKNIGPVYFNHSFYFETSKKFSLATSHHNQEFPAIIRKGTIVGFQFHPEKSQLSGQIILTRTISGLLNG